MLTSSRKLICHGHVDAGSVDADRAALARQPTLSLLWSSLRGARIATRELLHRHRILPGCRVVTHAIFRRIEPGHGDRRGVFGVDGEVLDRKSTRLNSSHVAISYAVFCLKKKKTN